MSEEFVTLTHQFSIANFKLQDTLKLNIVISGGISKSVSPYLHNCVGNGHTHNCRHCGCKLDFTVAT